MNDDPGSKFNVYFRTSKTGFSFDRYDIFLLPMLLALLAFPAVSIDIIRKGLWISSSDFSTPVLPIAYAAALVVFLSTIYISRSTLGNIRSILFGATLCLGAAGLYEMYSDIFQPNGLWRFHIVMSTFIVAGFVSAKYWRFDWKTLAVVVAFMMLFDVWYLAGNRMPSSYSDFIPLAFNCFEVILAFVLFFTPYYLGMRPPRRVG